MNIQDKADNLLDKVIDRQEKKGEEHDVSTEHTAETKVHPVHRAEQTEAVPVVEPDAAREETHADSSAPHVPPRPTEPPHATQKLKENPHQNFIYAASSAVAAVMTLFLIPLTLLITPATILFGISALLYSRKSERDGWNTWVPKFLGWATVLTGTAALFFGLFVMLILYIAKMA